ncbi:uncharacterized protein LOC128422828 [Podarcis raffonei]|uniref:uncharacterized protein LOC128422828 n=1 Tax=Podarcis raffonei TaxID=65483 RepID=UPI0023292109|nr:uncharacterized protein LOC128422828 [Podarcis raffonei]
MALSRLSHKHTHTRSLAPSPAFSGARTRSLTHTYTVSQSVSRASRSGPRSQPNMLGPTRPRLAPTPLGRMAMEGGEEEEPRLGVRVPTPLTSAAARTSDARPHWAGSKSVPPPPPPAPPPHPGFVSPQVAAAARGQGRGGSRVTIIESGGNSKVIHHKIKEGTCSTQPWDQSISLPRTEPCSEVNKLGVALVTNKSLEQQ